MYKTTYLLVNFGGPRHLMEIEEFLIALLTDQEVIRTPFPAFLHRLLFTRVAKKRTKKIAPDYALIGGKSPIFEDTEAIAASLDSTLGSEIITFHRYLPQTHSTFIKKMERIEADQIRVLPLFPQFSYATTGSIALWFAEHLSQDVVNKLSWIKSYCIHPGYIDSMEQCLRQCIVQNGLKEEECALLFSAHGLPQSFIATGDVYQEECRQTYSQLIPRFPAALSLLSYQSQFGKEEWIRPYTNEVCTEIIKWTQGRKHVIVIPLSFTSDHIETLYEIEHLYLPMIRKNGLHAYRCPALNLRKDWLQAIAEILSQGESTATQNLLRKPHSKFCKRNRSFRK